MKNIAIAFALLLSVAGTSFAGTNTISGVSVARELSVALQLNEGQYLKIKNLVNARLEEEKAGRATMQEINEKFTAAVLDELTSTQQAAYKNLLSASTGSIAVVK